MKFRLIFFSLVLLVFTAIVAGGLIYFNSMKELVYTESESLVQDTSEYFSDKIGAHIAPAKRAVAALAEEPPIKLLFSSPTTTNSTAAFQTLNNFNTALAASLSYVMDSNGKVIAANNQKTAESIVGNNYGSRPYFTAALTNEKLIPFIALGTTTQKRGIYLSHPVSVENRIVGVVVIKMPVAGFDDFFANTIGTVALTDEQNIVFASSRDDWLFKILGNTTTEKLIQVTEEKKLGGEMPSQLPVRFLKNSNRAILADGEEYLYFKSAVHGTAGWQVTYFYRASNLTRKFRQALHGKVFYSALLAALLLFGMTLLLSWQVSRLWKRQERSEKKHRAASSFLSQVFNLASDSIRIIDNNFNIIRANKTFAQTTGNDLNKIVGRKCYDIFWGPKCHTPECPLVRIKSGQKRVEYESIKESNTNSIVNCWVTAVPFRDSNGKVIGILESFRDITERIEAQISLEKAFEDAHKMAEDLAASTFKIGRQKMELEKAYDLLKQSQSQILQQEKMASIGQLAAGVAHEINNPMGFISSNMGTLGKYIERLATYLESQDNALSDKAGLNQELTALRKKLKIDYIIADSKDLVSESLEGAERVRKIVQGLKSFSRVDQAEKALVDINECLESTLNIAWNELKYKADVKKEYGDIPRTVCMPQQLNQAFMNLLINSAQAIENRGEISIKTWQENNYILISVSDTGKGIPQDKVDHIFEPFFTTKEVGKGTGLGLSIVYDIVVKNHKGEIQVTSEVGKGTTVTIKIPIVEKEDSPSAG